MITKETAFKFVKDLGLSSVRLAVASEVAKGLQKGGRAAVAKAAELAGIAPTKSEDIDDEVTWIGNDVIEVPTDKNKKEKK